MRKPLIFAICALLILTLIIYLWPSDLSVEIKQARSNEALLRSELERSKFELRKLKSSDSVKSKAVDFWRDSVKTLAQTKAKVKIVYRQAREATDLRPDSINLANEVSESRKLIDAQESEINGLHGLVAKLDTLVASKVAIIENQDYQLDTWAARFDNMVDLKNAEIQKQKKAKRAWRSGAIGSVALLVLVLI